MQNPNATLAATAGSISSGGIYLIGAFTKLSLNAEEGSLITVFVISVMLWIGRAGIKGCFKMIWDGQGEAD